MRRGRRRVLGRDLHIRQDSARPSLRQQERPGVTGGLDVEAGGVDRAGAHRHRVDSESLPCEVEEGHPWHDYERDPRVGAEHLDGRLRHQR